MRTSLLVCVSGAVLASAGPACAGILDLFGGAPAAPPVAAPAGAPPLPECPRDWPPRAAAAVEAPPAVAGKAEKGKTGKSKGEAGKAAKVPAAAADSHKAAAPEASRAAACQPARTVTANGRDLLGELVSMKQGFATGKPAPLFSATELKALGGAVPAASAVPAADAAGGLGQWLNGLFGGGTDALLDLLVAQMSYAAIDGILGDVLGDKAILERIEVELPNPARFEPAVRKKVLTMSAYLVAVKAAGAVIGSGQGSLDKAKESYREVLAMREQQARLLGEGAFVHEGVAAALKEEKARNVVLIGDEDRAYVNSFAGRPADELFKDPRAVNIVFNYLRARDPGRFKDYELKVAEVRGHYDAYVRATLGAGSMMGFTAMFARQARGFIEQHKLAGAAELTPLLQQAANEALGLAPKFVSLWESSDGQVDGTFTLERNGEVIRSGGSAEKVLGALDDAGGQRFRAELVASNDRRSLLYRLYTRAPQAAIEITDEATSKETRHAFARMVLGSEETPFLFRNAFGGLPPAERKKIGQRVFMEPAGEEDEADKACATVQKEIAGRALKLRNTDLRMLMYASAPTGAPSSSLRIGDYVIRMENPGVAGIADYEAFARQAQAAAVLRDYRQERADSRKKSL